MRRARKYSNTGFYHIVIRGVNKQNIFFDDPDKEKFLSFLKFYSKKYKVQVHAFCLMNNHVHMLLETKGKTISFFMQTFTSVYARFFNRKYDRIGHLFQDRFASEVIEDSQYFMTVFRYIIQNPEKAGMSPKEKYKWSSYNYYKKTSDLIQHKTALEVFKNKNKLYKFLDQKNNDLCLEIELRPSEKENFYITRIKEVFQTNSTFISPELPAKELYMKIKKLRQSKISINTISRLTGLPRGLIQKVS